MENIVISPVNEAQKHLVLGEQHILSASEALAVSGGGLFYDLGAFIAQVVNADESIYNTYGNTNRNHWQSI